MLLKQLVTTVFLLASTTAAMAGSISNGTWTPSKCGEEPTAPALKLGTEDDFNESIAAVNAWQAKANAYNGCIVDEANADNALITKTANAQQARFKAAVDKIKQETSAAKTKLGG